MGLRIYRSVLILSACFPLLVGCNNFSLFKKKSTSKDSVEYYLKTVRASLPNPNQLTSNSGLRITAVYLRVFPSYSNCASATRIERVEQYRTNYIEFSLYPNCDYQVDLALGEPTNQNYGQYTYSNQSYSGSYGRNNFTNFKAAYSNPSSFTIQSYSLLSVRQGDRLYVSIPLSVTSYGLQLGASQSALSSATLSSSSTSLGQQVSTDDVCYKANQQVCDIEKAIVEKTNEYRARAGLPVLKHTKELSFGARESSKKQAQRGTIGHGAFLSGETQSIIRQEFGYTVQMLAENVAMYFPSQDLMAVAAGFVNSWIGSGGHRMNILNSSATTIGVGVWQGRDGYWYATQIFGVGN